MVPIDGTYYIIIIVRTHHSIDAVYCQDYY